MTALRAKRASSRECKVLAWHFERPSYSGAIKILGSAPHACYRFIKGPLAEIRMTIRASSRKAFEYRTRLTDNRIWDMFALRQGDVIVATPPKCGTTWTQALVLSLLFEKPGMDKVMDDLSVWLDPAIRDQLPIARMFEAQSHRRCIKTHTPFDGIPFDPDCTYIAVFRHPIDAHFSMRRHVANLKEDLIQDRFPDEPTLHSPFFLVRPFGRRWPMGSPLRPSFITSSPSSQTSNIPTYTFSITPICGAICSLILESSLPYLV